MVSTDIFIFPKKIAFCVLIGSLWILPSFPVSAAGEIDQRRTDLQQLRNRIDQIDRNLDRKQATELSLVSDLQAVEKEESRLTDRMDRLSRVMKDSDQEMKLLEGRSVRFKKEIALIETDVRIRLRAMYQGYGDEFWKIMFSRVSPAQKAEDMIYFQRIVRHDRTLLAGFREKLAGLQETSSQIQRLQRQREKQLDDLEGHRQTLKKARQLKNRLIGRIRRDRKQLEEELAEMRAREEALTALIKRLETEYAREYSQDTGSFSRKRGTLPWPAGGEIRTGFGTWRHPELGTLYESQGIEISIDPGQPIKAVDGGRVVFANPLKGYGNLVIVDHGHNYHSLYARADRLAKKVGDMVKAGDTVGFAGNGSTSGMYFEIRNHGKPLDPIAWLKPR